jgi:hypothetical protein
MAGSFLEHAAAIFAALSNSAARSSLALNENLMSVREFLMRMSGFGHAANIAGCLSTGSF